MACKAHGISCFLIIPDYKIVSLKILEQYSPFCYILQNNLSDSFAAIFSKKEKHVSVLRLYVPVYNIVVLFTDELCFGLRRILAPLNPSGIVSRRQVGDR